MPTMGALHEGHLTLVKTAKALCSKTIASVFINPLQFAPHEDFDTYPRQPEHDAELLHAAGADALFLPERHDIYPENFSTSVQVSDVAEPLEGQFRPHFFGGVATVVAKLLNIVQPTHAFFGEKDYQQLCVIRRMVRDLNMPVEIVGVPVVREEDGLALSSRNAYLTADERQVAPKLYSTMLNCIAELDGGQDAADVLNSARQNLLTAGFTEIDYLELCDAETLQTAARADGRALRLLAAVHLGKTRLIDNLPL